MPASPDEHERRYPRCLIAYVHALANPRTRPSCLIGGLALLFLSLVYCGGLAAIVLVERDESSGRLYWRFAPPPAVNATPAATPHGLPLATPTPAARISVPYRLLPPHGVQFSWTAEGVRASPPVAFSLDLC